MCEQMTFQTANDELSAQGVYEMLRPQIDAVLDKYNFSSSHIVATQIADGLSIRYNIGRSVFSTSAQEDDKGVQVIFKLMQTRSGIRMELPSNRLQFYPTDALPLVPTNAKVQTWRKIDVYADQLPLLSEAICADISDYLLAYPSDFACCSLYEKCSDAGRCIQANQDMAASCYYKKNLLRGIVFYGENKNAACYNNKAFAMRVCNDEAKASKRPLKGKSLISFPPDFTVVDIETTGFTPEKDEIIEISAIRVRNNLPEATFSSLIKPSQKINNFIANLTGITNEMLYVAPDIDIVLDKFSKFIGDDIILGHNVNFDINFLYDRLLEIKPLTNDYIDTMRIAKRILPQLSSYRLCSIAEHLGVHQANAHRALSDCETTLKCFNEMGRIATGGNCE